jgi:hypothetical protein
MLSVIDPSRSKWKFFLEILKVFVAEAVGADKGSCFGVTDVKQLVPVLLEEEMLAGSFLGELQRWRSQLP